MTPIIVAAIAAVVFLVTLYIVAISVWKHEAKKRNSSLRNIENSLNEMVHELTTLNAEVAEQGNRAQMRDNIVANKDLTFEEYQIPDQAYSRKSTEKIEAAEVTEYDVAVSDDEINLDFIDLDGIESIDLDGLSIFDSVNSMAKEPADYSTGRSGKRYTAEELEALIKE